jgi:hypothetical protein
MEMSPSWEAASRSATQNFIETEDSLPFSQEPSTGPYTEPYQSSPYLSYDS